MKRMILAATLVALAVSGPAAAVVPPLISYQGVLTDNAGVLVPDGPHDFTFTIWDAPAGGTLLYCETQVAVPTVKGGFSVIVGEGTLCAPNVALQSLAFDGQLYLQVAVDQGSPLAPRIKLTSAPYSFMAKTVSGNAIMGAHVIDGSLTSVDIADNSLTALDIGPNIVSSIEGVSNDGGNVDLVAGGGLLITPDDVANTITVTRTPPTYRISGNLNTAPINATTTWTKIANFQSFTKSHANSSIEVMLNSRVLSGTFAGGATGVFFAVRIDDLETSLANLGAVTTNNSTEFISISAVFTGLSAASHTVSVWARTNIGTSTGVGLDPGGWGGRIIVKEAL